VLTAALILFALRASSSLLTPTSMLTEVRRVVGLPITSKCVRLDGGGVVRGVGGITVSALVPHSRENTEPGRVLAITSDGVELLIAGRHVRRELYHYGAYDLELRVARHRHAGHSHCKGVERFGNGVKNDSQVAD